MRFAVEEMPFSFDAFEHTYTNELTGEVIPHITGLLKASGWVDDQWFTDESSARGQAVHKVTADYDLGLLDLASFSSDERPNLVEYLENHRAAMAVLRPTWLHIEEPFFHPAYRFAGRMDRVATVFGARSIIEIKAAVPQRSHQIQTALQAVLDGYRSGLSPESVPRYCEYFRPSTGEKIKKKVVPHTDRRDIDEALRIIKRFCL